MRELFMNPKFLDLLKSPNCSAEISDYTVTVNTSDEILNISIRKETELNKFTRFLQTLNDELFLEVCTELGTTQLNEINNLINSDDPMQIKEGIETFNVVLRDILTKKIEYYSECLHNLNR